MHVPLSAKLVPHATTAFAQIPQSAQVWLCFARLPLVPRPPGPVPPGPARQIGFRIFRPSGPQPRPRRAKLGSFRTFCPRPTPVGPRPTRPCRANWVCFAREPTPLVPQTPPRPAKLASFRTIGRGAPRVRGRGSGVSWLIPGTRSLGKLALFRTTGPLRPAELL